MPPFPRDWLGYIFKLGRSIAESTDGEEPEVVSTDNPTAEPMNPYYPYWESDKQKSINQEDSDLYADGLDSIPDVPEKTAHESIYSYNALSYYIPEGLKNYYNNKGVPEPTKPGSGISSGGRDASVVAGIVVAVVSGIIVLGALIAVVMYRHYVHRNVTSMNFDNPVYRKTTENQFALEQNGYAPGSKLYPSTVGEEAQEPLNTPGTNEFV